MATPLLLRSPAVARPRRAAGRHIRMPGNTGTDLLLLTGVCGFFFFHGLGAGEFYRTESLRAILAAEALRSGDWVVPRLYGEPLFTKPPGMYAAIAMASLPGGRVTEATARLPAALAATGTVFLFYWFFRRALGRTGGMVAALLLPLSVMWLDKATAAEIDMPQTFWVTASILSFLRALEATTSRTYRPEVVHWRISSTGDVLSRNAPPEKTPESARAWPWWLAAMLCVAGGVLTKWTAPVFFYGTAVPLLWRRGRLRLLWCAPHLLGAALAATLCAGWVGAVVAREGWAAFAAGVGREAAVHLSPGHHRAGYPWGEALAHPLVIWAASLPAGLFALPALRHGFAGLWGRQGQRLREALQCWLWPGLIFWSVLPGHGPRQAMPLLPALAGLAAMTWTAWLNGRLAWPFLRLRPARALVGIMLCWAVVKLAYVHIIVPERAEARQARAKGELVAACVPPTAELYLFHLKDEGILYYYGRPARRLAGPEQLPCRDREAYCILDADEWRPGDWPRRAEPVLRLRDEQGAPLVLVRCQPEPCQPR